MVSIISGKKCELRQHYSAQKPFHPTRPPLPLKSLPGSVQTTSRDLQKDLQEPPKARESLYILLVLFVLALARFPAPPPPPSCKWKMHLRGGWQPHPPPSVQENLHKSEKRRRLSFAYLKTVHSQEVTQHAVVALKALRSAADPSGLRPNRRACCSGPLWQCGKSIF